MNFVSVRGMSRALKSIRAEETHPEDRSLESNVSSPGIRGERLRRGEWRC